MAEDERVASLEAELQAARRTVEALVQRIERESALAAPDRGAWLRAIGQLQTTVAARSRDLAAREEYYRALYDQSPDAIMTLDGAGRVLDCNRTAELNLGRPRGAMVGRPVADLFTDNSGAALMSLLWSGFVGVGDSELDLPSGRRMGFSVARLATDQVLIVLRDVTQRRALEKALEQARRQAGFGRLAAELASEITASISVVAGRIELLRLRPPEDAQELQASLGAMGDHCRRLDGVVANLRALGRPRPPRLQRLPARDLVDRALAAEAVRLRKVSIQVAVPEDLWLDADPEHALLVLRNLLVYLVEHMPKGRTLKVGAGEDPDGAELVLTADELSLPPEVARQLRGPATEPARRLDPSAGLPLAIATVLVADAGGRLSLEPSGERLRLRLSARRLPSAAAGPSVLVVDDDQLLCDTVTWMLAGQGLLVRAVTTAEEALRVLDRAQFDCILVDLVLPGMDGVQFLDTVRRRWPQLRSRLVLTTGAIDDPPEGVALLRKPFDRSQLLEVVLGPKG